MYGPPLCRKRKIKVTGWSAFIAGLLYLLRFKRVDNLGAYRIPPETGILIPSSFINYLTDGYLRCPSEHF